MEDLQDQLSDILEILGSSYACLTARTSTDMHSRLPELKEQVLCRMSDHSHSITIMTSELGMQHPFVIKHRREHSSLEVIVSTLIEMVRLGSLQKDIKDILPLINSFLTAKKRSDMHSNLPDLKEQVLSLMSDHSHGISILANQLGTDHPLVIMFKLDHASLEATLDKLLEAVGRVQTTVTPTRPGKVVVSGSDSAQPEFQLPAPTASAQCPDVVAITTATKRVIKTLKDLYSEIAEVIDTIHINIDHQRAELWVCLPELGKVLSSLMEDHSLHVKLVRCLAFKLGDHDLVEEIEQEQVHLEVEVSKAFELVEMVAMDESCTEGQDTVDNTPQSYDGSALAATAVHTSQEGSTEYQDTLTTTQAPAFKAGPVTSTTKTGSASAGARTSSKLQVSNVSHVLVDTAEYSPPGIDEVVPPTNLQASCRDAQPCENQHVETTFTDHIQRVHW